LAERVLAQDRLPKRELITRHRARVDAGEGSIIFGLASFAEGIDLPGDYLTHVVITRLPFAVPDDPVGATLAEWIESRGGNPFMRISVPDASIKLVQACGRLIRKEADSGRITRDGDAQSMPSPSRSASGCGMSISTVMGAWCCGRMITS
jgi:ATP-dependent DNA helicase DinG